MRANQPEIIIADNGCGMDAEILDQAIRLGSLVEKDSASDLGKFGMGLCTATLSLCTQTVVLTRAQDGDILKAIDDVGEVQRLNKFVSFFGKADTEDKTLFEDLIGNAPSGTVIVLHKCDNIQNTNLSIFSKTLAKHMARIFRYFLSADTAIFVNDIQLVATDPLE